MDPRKNRTLHRSPDGTYALLPIEEGEPRMLLSLAAAGDMARTWGGAEASRAEPPEAPQPRESLFTRLGLSAAAVVSLQQIHSQRVFWCDEAEGATCKGDGLLTLESGVVPAVTVADCMPIYLFAAGTPLRGLVHSGWKGTGIVLRALERAGERIHLPPARVTAVLGPAIGPCCYRVDEERARSFAGLWGPESVRYRDGAPYLDLYTANRRALQRAGVEEIREVRECTVCGEGFGSFRREGPESFTHMLAMIADFPLD